MSSLTGALFAGLSGLDVNTTQMNVVGNNIANANTTAFKSSRVLFSPQFYVTDQAGTPPSTENGGTNPSQHGLGATVANIQQNFTPGAIQSTGVSTDMAIDGTGFFVVKNAGKQQYTRNGAFTLNSTNQLVTGTGGFVQGFSSDSNGSVLSGTVSNITIPLGQNTIATPTTNVKFQGNLNAAGTPPAGVSILTSGDVTSADGTGTPTTTSLLTNVASTTTPTVPLFAVGDTLTLAGAKGGRSLAATTYTVTATSSVQDVLNFYDQGLAVDPTASPNAALPAPGATLEADAATPGSAKFVITGNEGSANTLEIPPAGFLNQSGATPLQFADGTNAAGVKSDPSGESVHTTFTTYDSLGNPVNVDMTSVLESTSTGGNTWRFFASSVDNKSGSPVLGDGTLTYNSAGKLVSSTGTSLNIDRTGTGAQSPLSINLDFSGTTELSGNQSSLVMNFQDGMPPGTLNTFSVGTDGIITGAYSNGQTRTLGQVAVASFANPHGLDNVGGNTYEQGASSGVAVLSAPEQLGTGALRSGSLELSNVDLSTEFTNLIIASTGFSASSRVITTGDQLIQELLNSSH